MGDITAGQARRAVAEPYRRFSRRRRSRPGEAAFRPRPRHAGRHQDRDDPCLLSDAAAPLSVGGRCRAGIRRHRGAWGPGRANRGRRGGHRGSARQWRRTRRVARNGRAPRRRGTLCHTDDATRGGTWQAAPRRRQRRGIARRVARVSEGADRRRAAGAPRQVLRRGCGRYRSPARRRRGARLRFAQLLRPRRADPALVRATGEAPDNDRGLYRRFPEWKARNPWQAFDEGNRAHGRSSGGAGPRRRGGARQGLSRRLRCRRHHRGDRRLGPLRRRVDRSLHGTQTQPRPARLRRPDPSGACPVARIRAGRPGSCSSSMAASTIS